MLTTIGVMKRDTLSLDYSSYGIYGASLRFPKRPLRPPMDGKGGGKGGQLENGRFQAVLVQG